MRLDRAISDAFQRDGHVLVRDVATADEIAACRPVVERVVHDVTAKNDTQHRIDDYSKLFLQVTNIWRVDAEARRVVFTSRWASIAAELLGVPSVRLYHDQALFKPAGADRTPWHQDRYYWPLDTDKTLTMWLPLVDVSEEMGPPRFASGSHRDRTLRDLAISSDTDRKLATMIEDRKWPVISAAVPLGSATFHAGGTVHSAGANRTNVVREVLTIIYYAADARVAEPENDNQRVDMEVFLPGTKPGEAAATKLNPVLYP